MQQARQLVAHHFRYTVLRTNTIAAKLYNLRCKFRCSNAHPQHTIENRIAKAHSTLMIPAPTLVLPPCLAQSHWQTPRIKESPTPHSLKTNCERRVSAPNPIKIPTNTSTPLWQRLFKTTCSLPSPQSVSQQQPMQTPSLPHNVR